MSLMGDDFRSIDQQKMFDELSKIKQELAKIIKILEGGKNG